MEVETGLGADTNVFVVCTLTSGRMGKMKAATTDQRASFKLQWVDLLRSWPWRCARAPDKLACLWRQNKQLTPEESRSRWTQEAETNRCRQPVQGSPLSAGPAQMACFDFKGRLCVGDVITANNTTRSTEIEPVLGADTTVFVACTSTSRRMGGQRVSATQCNRGRRALTPSTGSSQFLAVEA